MTQIVIGCDSKKALKGYAQQLNEGVHAQHNEPCLRDPSLFNPMRGGDVIYLRNVAEGEKWTVTNHPKRSWFATVTRRNGKLEVK